MHNPKSVILSTGCVFYVLFVSDLFPLNFLHEFMYMKQRVELKFLAVINDLGEPSGITGKVCCVYAIRFNSQRSTITFPMSSLGFIETLRPLASYFTVKSSP